MLIASPKVQKRFNEQRRALGLPEVDYDAIKLPLDTGVPPAEIVAAPRGTNPEFAVEAVEQVGFVPEAEAKAIEGGALGEA